MSSFYSKDRVTDEKKAKQTYKLIKGILRSPSVSKQIIPIMIISLAVGFIFSVDLTGLKIGIIVLALPTFIAGLLTKPLINAFKGDISIRRSLFVTLTGLNIIAIAAIIYRIINTFTQAPLTFTLILAYSITIWIRHAVLITAASPHHLRVLAGSLIQALIGYFAIYFLLGMTIKETFAMYLITIIMVISIVLLVETFRIPFKKNFGIDPIAILKYMKDHLTKGRKGGTRELEKIGYKFGVPIDVYVGSLSFKRNDNSIKVSMVVPYVHPGPFGYVGGSDLPSKLSASLQDITPNIMVAHSTTTHDYNPVADAECEKIATELRGIIANTKFSNKISHFVRHQEDGNINMAAQLFGDSVLFTFTSAPHSTDDIDFGTGFNIITNAKNQVEQALMIDAHNSLRKNARLYEGSVYISTNKSYRMMNAAKVALEKAKKTRANKIKAGYAEFDNFKIHEGFGAKGIQVLLLETGAGRKIQRTAYILYDGNNMLPGVREKIHNEIKELVDEAKIMTTDNHAVNYTPSGYNPIGFSCHIDKIINITKKLVEEAIDDLEPVSVGINTGFVKNVYVFGHEASAKMASVIFCLLYTSPSPRDLSTSRMPSSA